MFFPRLIAKDMTDSFRYIIMELLGPSLGSLKKGLPDHKFSPATASRLLLHMLRCIEAFHSHGYTHRDIKPGNFLLRPGSDEPVCLIDFGLAQRCFDENTKEHRQQRTKAGFAGTCKYASVHAHEKIDLSRRDDLLSWIYSAIDLFQGRMPWTGARDHRAAYAMKRSVKPQIMFVGMPPEFLEMYEYLGRLEWAETPNYAMMKEKMEKVIVDLRANDEPWDWEKLSDEDLNRMTAVDVKARQCVPGRRNEVAAAGVGTGCMACQVW
jgi:serine/threonine protein kinase